MPKKKDIPPTSEELASLASTLALANTEYDEASRAHNRSQQDLDKAEVQLSNAQRHFDEAVTQLREVAPLDSNWGQDRLQRIREAKAQEKQEKAAVRITGDQESLEQAKAAKAAAQAKAEG